MPPQKAIAKNASFETVLYSAVKIPGIKINRDNFLQKELSRYFNRSVVRKAIETNPAQAGISQEHLEKIAKACINFETTKVTAISSAAGIPGGLAIAATIPADIAQFFGHIIRILQKLAYLYGWQEIFQNNNFNLDDNLDDETFTELTLFIGVMFGVHAANAAISKIANSAATKVEKTLIRTALTKGTIYPIVKKVAASIGIKMNKEIFAKSIGKMIPGIGAILSGGVSFFSFKPMAKRLQNYLVTLPMANIDFYAISHDNDINVDFSDIVIDVDDFNIAAD